MTNISSEDIINASSLPNVRAMKPHFSIFILCCNILQFKAGKKLLEFVGSGNNL